MGEESATAAGPVIWQRGWLATRISAPPYACTHGVRKERVLGPAATGQSRCDRRWTAPAASSRSVWRACAVRWQGFAGYGTSVCPSRGLEGWLGSSRCTSPGPPKQPPQSVEAASKDVQHANLPLQRLAWSDRSTPLKQQTMAAEAQDLRLRGRVCWSPPRTVAALMTATPPAASVGFEACLRSQFVSSIDSR